MASGIPAEVLAQLSPTKKAALETYVRSVSTPPINISMKPPSANTRIPQYDPEKQSAAVYLEQLEAYFKSQGHDEKDYLGVVPTVLEDHVNSWLRNKKTATYTWSQFKTDYKARFDGVSAQQRRQLALITRTQRDDEPVENFVWEMMELAKQVSPAEKTAESVE
jgi:hypothetical protein